MGDPRHKKSPPAGESAKNSPALRREAAEAIARNKKYNRLGGRQKGAPGWRIASHAEIAAELSRRVGHTVSQTMVSNILGGARKGTEVDLVDESVYIPMIRDMLELAAVGQITVPLDRVEVLQRIADLPEAEFAPYRESVERRR